AAVAGTGALGDQRVPGLRKQALRDARSLALQCGVSHVGVRRRQQSPGHVHRPGASARLRGPAAALQRPESPAPGAEHARLAAALAARRGECAELPALPRRHDLDRAVVRDVRTAVSLLESAFVTQSCSNCRFLVTRTVHKARTGGGPPQENNMQKLYPLAFFLALPSVGAGCAGGDDDDGAETGFESSGTTGTSFGTAEDGGDPAAGADADAPNVIPTPVPMEITADTTLTCDRVWYLTGTTTVRGATLTLQPGTTVFGSAGSALVIEKDARIHAVGRPDAPIVFTSSNPKGQRARANWG